MLKHHKPYKSKYKINPNPSPIGTMLVGFGLSCFGGAVQSKYELFIGWGLLVCGGGNALKLLLF
jgi:hypothetical protein